MTVESQVAQATFQSGSGDGIHEVVLGAAQAIMGSDPDTPGLLQMQPVAQSLGSPLWLGLEATFAEGVGGRVIAKLDVHVRKEVADMPAGLVREGIAELGGGRFTNICFGPAASADVPSEIAREDVLDVTVSFPTWVPVLAANQALFGDALQAVDRELCRAVLDTLGVSFGTSSGELRVRGWQLRVPMKPEAQLAAFQAAAKTDRRTSIYSAVLPPSTSVRIERGVAHSEGTRKPYVDVCLSRGLAPTRATTATEMRVMQEILGRHLGVDFGGREYKVSSCRWSMPPPPEPKTTGGFRMPFARG
jgi:hypothetical protein